MTNLQEGIMDKNMSLNKIANLLLQMAQVIKFPSNVKKNGPLFLLDNKL
jgi:hypothetical protein